MSVNLCLERKKDFVKNKVAYIFDLEIDSDSRAQKEIATLIKNGFNVHVLEWNKDRNYSLRIKNDIIRNVNVKIESIGIKVKKTQGFKSNIRYLLKYEIFLLKWLLKNRKKIDIIHCVNFDTAFVCLIFSRLFRKKIIYDVFDDYADAHDCNGKLYSMIKRLDYLTMKKCNYVIICSEKRRTQLWKRLDNVVVIHNSPDIDIDIENQNENFDRRMKIVYVGNLTTKRMIEDLLSIVASEKNYELHCGGTGPLKDIVEQYAIKYDNIFYYGKMKYENVINLEKQCDVIPAIYDPSLKNNTFAAPNKFYEAMYLGKPTIMVHNTGMDKLVEEYHLGITIDNNKEDLRKALFKIRNNIFCWKKDSERIKSVYQQNFSWDVMEKRIIYIYKELEKEN